MNDDFFEIPKEHSLIKNAIVKKYFDAWSNVLSQKNKFINYIDFFSGQGKFENGTDSTPLNILNLIASKPKLSSCCKTFFNDYDIANYELLTNNIRSNPFFQNISNKIQVYNITVDENIINTLKDLKEIDLKYPTLSYLDPFGYKGLLIDLMRYLIQGFGNEIILFFNFNRINAALSNKMFDLNMKYIFGASEFTKLKSEIETINCVDERERTIISAYKNALLSGGANHCLTFRIKDNNSTRTNFYIIHATKHQTGFNIMKDIMSKYSTVKGKLEFDPNTKFQTEYLFLPNDFEDAWIKDLLKTYSGNRVTFKNILAKHSINWDYTIQDYRFMLICLENEGTISTNRLDKHKRNNQLPEWIEITFPKRNN